MHHLPYERPRNTRELPRVIHLGQKNHHPRLLAAIALEIDELTDRIKKIRDPVKRVEMDAQIRRLVNLLRSIAAAAFCGCLAMTAGAVILAGMAEAAGGAVGSTAAGVAAVGARVRQ